MSMLFWFHSILLCPEENAQHKKRPQENLILTNFPIVLPIPVSFFLLLKAWHLVIGCEVTWGLVYFWCGDGRRSKLVSQSHRFVILLTFQITNAVSHPALKTNHVQIGLCFSFLFFFCPVPLYRTCLKLNRPATLPSSLSAHVCPLTPAPPP